MTSGNEKERGGGALNFALVPVIFSLAWPTMLQELMDTAVQYVDTAMVGALGTAATAAVGSTTTVNWLLGSSVRALGIGFLSYIARAFGAGDGERAKRAAAQAVTVTLLVGTLLTALTLGLSGLVPVWMQVDEAVRPLASAYFFILYLPMLPRCAEIIFGTILRAAGDTRTPMHVGIFINGLNVLLNFLLIYETRTVNILGMQLSVYGAGMGVRGAAAASAAAITAGGLLMALALWRNEKISPRGYSIRPDGRVLVPCLRVAVPNMLQRFCASMGYVVFASMINSLGQLSAAAHTIANTVESAFYIPGYGMQTAAATLAGNCVGAGDRCRMDEMGNMIVLLEVGMMTVTGALLFAFAPDMAGLFSRDAQVVALSGAVLRMVALSEPFYGISIVTEGMLLGAGETGAPFAFNLISMWGVRIVGTYICVTLSGMGLRSAWACMIAGNMVLLALFRLYYRFGRWRKSIGNL